MSLISTNDITTYTDKLATIAMSLEVYLGTGLTGTASPLVADFVNAVVGTGTLPGITDIDVLEDIVTSVKLTRDYVDFNRAVPGLLQPAVQGIQSHIAGKGSSVSSTISNLDSYASHYNAASYHAVTYHPAFARLYYLWTGKAQMLSAGNVISPIVVLATGVVSGSNEVTFTAGSAINMVSTLSAGSQGYCADNVCLRVISGTLTGTLTATGYDQNGTVHYWHVNANALTPASTRTLLNPRSAGSFCQKLATGITYNGDGYPSTFVLESVSR